MPEDKKPKRKRRRNFAKVISEIEAYCRISIEILQTLAENDFINGKIRAFQDIREKIGGENDKE